MLLQNRPWVEDGEGVHHLQKFHLPLGISSCLSFEPESTTCLPSTPVDCFTFSQNFTSLETHRMSSLWVFFSFTKIILKFIHAFECIFNPSVLFFFFLAECSFIFITHNFYYSSRWRQLYTVFYPENGPGKTHSRKLELHL